MLPTTIEECYKELDAILDDEARDAIKSLSGKEQVVDFHFTLGAFIRNEWKMWEEGSTICRLFARAGLSIHPDDVSRLILEGYYDYLNR